MQKKRAKGDGMAVMGGSNGICERPGWVESISKSALFVPQGTISDELRAYSVNSLAACQMSLSKKIDYVVILNKICCYSSN